MSSLYRVKKDYRRRLVFRRYEQKKLFLRYIYTTQDYTPYTVNLKYRKAVSRFYTFPKESSISMIQNRCVISGFGRAMRDFKVSRSFFKRYANKGKFVGVKKTTW
jgi:ribosomal protein S14